MRVPGTRQIEDKVCALDHGKGRAGHAGWGCKPWAGEAHIPSGGVGGKVRGGHAGPDQARPMERDDLGGVGKKNSVSDLDVPQKRRAGSCGSAS